MYNASPAYSARQQCLPTSVVELAVGSDVAEPATSALVLIDVPPAVQSPPFAATSVGLHKKNSTVPVGVGPVPDTVAVSVAVVPGTTLFVSGLDFVMMVGVCKTVVKHSSVPSV